MEENRTFLPLPLEIFHRHMVGDTVMLVITRYEMGKKQIFGKILAKW